MSPTERENANGVRESLERLTDLLDTVRHGLLELHDQVPPTLEELSLGDLATRPKLSTQIRADLRCLLSDAIEPALRGLRELVASIPPATAIIPPS
jgi:hypothetical protein